MPEKAAARHRDAWLGLDLSFDGDCRGSHPKPDGAMPEETGQGRKSSAATGQHPPDIATIRMVCHAGKITHDSRVWYVFQRRISIYLTWLLLRTGLAPNHVTLISVGLAILGGSLLAMRPAEIALAGSLTLVAHHLFDKADGDIARFRGTYSIVGVYLDELGHGLAFAGIFLGLGIHLSWRTSGDGALIALLVSSAAGALAMVLARLHKSVGFLLYAQYVLTQPELLPRPRDRGRWGGFSRDAVHRSRMSDGRATPWATRIRDLAFVLSDFSFMLLLVCLGTTLECITGNDAFLRGVLFAEAALQGSVFVMLVVVNAAVNVESEVTRLDMLVMQRTRSGGPR